VISKLDINKRQACFFCCLATQELDTNWIKRHQIL